MKDIDQAKWYVVHTATGQEKSAEENLKKIIENHNLQDAIFATTVPVEEDIVEKNGKRKVVERIKFPGYVFVKMIESPVNCYNVLRTRGITSFTGPKGAPIPIFPEEVKRLGLEKIDIVDIDVKVGDNIRVISGALESFIGVVDDISLERQKVQVIVSMFGRQIHVELDIAQIEKISG